MHLPRHTIESHAAVPLFQHASFCSPDPASCHPRSPSDLTQTEVQPGIVSDEISQPAVFSCATLNGFWVAQTDPLKLLARRSWSPAQGGLSHAVPVQHTSLQFLVGGGRVPRFAPNKVILWDEAAEYSTELPAGTPRDPSLDDDDDLDSVGSRRASTVFSAGSEFDAYGKHRSDDFDHADSPEQERRPSSISSDGLRFSTSSLISSDDLQDASSPVSYENGGFASSTQGPNTDVMNHSIGASSLGIGRLQASHISDTSERAITASADLDPIAQGAASSPHSHSIMASSANLADPFGQEGVPSSISGPPSEENGRGSPGSYPDQGKAGTRPQHLFSSQTARRPGAGLIDSVSSMATTATDSTAKAPPKICRGCEVAELEFSEVVRGIHASSIHMSSPKQGLDSSKGKGRATTGPSGIKGTGSARICVVLVVLLSSKAIIFEMLPPSAAAELEGRSRQPDSSAWRIKKRATVQTYKNPKGLGSVTPYYEGTSGGTRSPASAIVAVPGRQKGHVQILRIKLHGVAHARDNPVLSNPTSPLGASSIIVAHESTIAAITLSPNGRLLATASSKGTLIRIWSNEFYGGVGSNTERSQVSSHSAKATTPGRTGFGARLVRELRRGTDTATILSIAFAPDASLVAAASDKGTIHIFLLVEAAPATLSGSVGDQSASSPWSSSRAANLGRAAAQYLPAGIGTLAGQIPPSVLPQYLKSEWSSAQFRIPLKSFGASSRHYSTSPATEDRDLYGTGSSSGAPPGTEKSTEGAWAQMRSRISDIRKGEASVDEKIFLSWIREASPSSGLDPPVGNLDAKADNSRSRGSRTHIEAPQFSPGAQTSSQRDARPRQRYRLVALTTSGGWYKLAVSVSKSPAEEALSESTVLDMYRRDGSSQGAGSDRGGALECRLLEFRPMVALLDGWRA